MATIDFETIERNYDLEDYEKATVGADAWQKACELLFETTDIPQDGSVLTWWDGNMVYIADSNGVALDGYDNINKTLATYFEAEYAEMLDKEYGGN